MEKLRFSCCPRAKVGRQGPLDSAKTQPRIQFLISPLSLTSLKTPWNDVDATFKLLDKILWYELKWTHFIVCALFIVQNEIFVQWNKNFWLVFCITFRVYNLLVADIMKTKLFYISYTSKYADLKALLENSDLRSYPLVDSEGKEICQFRKLVEQIILICARTLFLIAFYECFLCYWTGL